MKRQVRVRVHALAGSVALLTIAVFWTSTVVSELLLGSAAVTSVKSGVLHGMFLLIPALLLASGSGFALAAQRTGPLLAAKKRRMRVIGANGLLILLPSAFFLHARAVSGEFDGGFYVVQALELAAGGLNFTLLGLNLRDGLRLRLP